MFVRLVIVLRLTNVFGRTRRQRTRVFKAIRTSYERNPFAPFAKP
jgi:hypothetical protein